MKNSLTINADDFGLSPEVNQAIKICFEKKKINRTTIMVNAPFYSEARKICEHNGFKKNVGLHLNLTYGNPINELTKSSVLCDKNGQFNSEIRKSKYRFYIGRKLCHIIYCELEAQIKKFIEDGFELKHIDSHQHIHTNYWVFLQVKKLYKKYSFNSMRISRNVFPNSMGLFTYIYKAFINKKICKLLIEKENNVKMGTLFDYNNNAFIDGNINEIMVHPIIIGNKVIDITHNDNIVLID